MFGLTGSVVTLVVFGVVLYVGIGGVIGHIGVVWFCDVGWDWLVIGHVCVVGCCALFMLGLLLDY